MHRLRDVPVQDMSGICIGAYMRELVYVRVAKGLEKFVSMCLSIVMPRTLSQHGIRYMDPDGATVDDVESNVLAPAEGTTPVESEPVTMGQGGGAKKAYLQLREFVVLVEKAFKAEELVKERKKIAIESRDSKKRQMGKLHQFSSKRLRELTTRSNASVGFLKRNKNKQNTTRPLLSRVLVVLSQIGQSVCNVVGVISASAEEIKEVWHGLSHGRGTWHTGMSIVPHGCVLWPCDLRCLITSETECQGFQARAETRACRGGMRDTDVCEAV
ncbi:Methionine--tRNA ligase [Gossypium arboreum]|uniref:Methionine--tRNA ligase n=1 Tax=Gossypium arboreum TaxID=29729 RepID=A0A0B0P3J8_GOSAR|nr:Methionine--tRNA ligase [Gossypium arboreum]